MQRSCFLLLYGCEPIQNGPTVLQIITNLLRGGPVVQPAGMTSSVPCRKLEFRPSRRHGASYKMANWLPRDRKLAQVAEHREGGREKGGWGVWGGGGGGGGGDREWRGDKFLEEDVVETRTEGDKPDFWSKWTTHNSLNKA